MKPDHRTLLAEAITALKLRDVMLNACSFKRPNPPPPESEDSEVRQLTKRGVKYVLGAAPSGSKPDEANLLQVIVSLGIRITGMQRDRPVYFEIEADFLVEYDVKHSVSEAAIRTFAELNSVHNVWPFWRQHVFDTVSRARLPHMDVPLFGGLACETPTPASKKRIVSRRKSPA